MPHTHHTSVPFRTAKDGAPGGMNGRRFLLPCLNSHKTVDVLVLALGVNDLKHHLGLKVNNA